MVGRVQECGCIALPEEIQKKTGLYPGATFQIECTPDGIGLILQPLETRQPSDPYPSSQCG
jgi:bifunctional DNA-binding transcriptional regulator/antitoxin component of YhaV-PrlF toxin-antitoxin module